MRIWLAWAAVAVLSAEAWAADPAVLARFEKTLEEIRKSHYEYTGGRTFIEEARLRYGALTTFAGYAIDDEGGTTRILRQSDTKFWFNGQLRGHTLYGRIRLRYQDFNTGDAFAGTSDGLVEPLGDRYWYRFDWRAEERAEQGIDTTWNWWVQAGRQYVDWVSGFVLSETLYAARAGVEFGRLEIEGLFAVTPDSIVDFDASRPNFTTDTERYFFGFAVTYTGLPAHRPFFYLLSQQDENDLVLTGGLRFGYDSTYVAIGSDGQLGTGQVFYRAEFVYAVGNSTSDVLGTFPQTIDDVQAWAGRLLIGFIPYDLRHRSVVFTFEILLGSGDDDRIAATQTAGGNRSGTDDESFINFGYQSTGFALSPDLANLLSVRVGASATPLPEHSLFRNLQVAVDVFYYGKMDDMAPLSVTTTVGESYVGFGVDLSLAWQITSDLSVDLSYGIFIPGDAVAGSERHFGYLGFSYGF